MNGQNSYVKRIQKDYSLPFNLQGVKEVEFGVVISSTSSMKI